MRVYWGGGNFDLGNYYPRDPWDVAHLLLFLKLCHFYLFRAIFRACSVFPVILCTSSTLLYNLKSTLLCSNNVSL